MITPDSDLASSVSSAVAAGLVTWAEMLRVLRAPAPSTLLHFLGSRGYPASQRSFREIGAVIRREARESGRTTTEGETEWHQIALKHRGHAFRAASIALGRLERQGLAAWRDEAPLSLATVENYLQLLPAFAALIGRESPSRFGRYLLVHRAVPEAPRLRLYAWQLVRSASFDRVAALAEALATAAHTRELLQLPSAADLPCATAYASDHAALLAAIVALDGPVPRHRFFGSLKQQKADSPNYDWLMQLVGDGRVVASRVSPAGMWLIERGMRVPNTLMGS